MNKGTLQIKLTEESRAKLLSNVTPKFNKIYADHVTLFYGCENSDYNHLLGKLERIKIICLKSNNDIQAVTVNIDSDLPCKNKVPHITISTNEGVRPVVANEMLESKNHTNDGEVDFEIEGIIEFEVI